MLSLPEASLAVPYLDILPPALCGFALRMRFGPKESQQHGMERRCQPE